MVGKTALNKERYHLNGGPFQTLFISRIYISTTLCQMCQLCQKNGPEAKNHNPKAPDLRSLSISSPVFFTVI